MAAAESSTLETSAPTTLANRRWKFTRNQAIVAALFAACSLGIVFSGRESAIVKMMYIPVVIAMLPPTFLLTLMFPGFNYEFLDHTGGMIFFGCVAAVYYFRLALAFLNRRTRFDKTLILFHLLILGYCAALFSEM